MSTGRGQNQTSKKKEVPKRQKSKAPPKGRPSKKAVVDHAAFKTTTSKSGRKNGRGRPPAKIETSRVEVEEVAAIVRGRNAALKAKQKAAEREKKVNEKEKKAAEKEKKAAEREKKVKEAEAKKAQKVAAKPALVEGM